MILPFKYVVAEISSAQEEHGTDSAKNNLVNSPNEPCRTHVFVRGVVFREQSKCPDFEQKNASTKAGQSSAGEIAIETCVTLAPCCYKEVTEASWIQWFLCAIDVGTLGFSLLEVSSF